MADTSSRLLLEGRVAVITGAAQGIGRAVALAYAREGAAVAMADIAGEAVDAAAREVAETTGGRTLAAALDVTDAEATEAVANRIAAELGGVDLVVPNAGILALHHAVDTPLATWRRVLDVNLTGAFVTATTFAGAWSAPAGAAGSSSPPRSSACAAGARTRPTAPRNSAWSA
jgi:NAD(P)-dependent dehydrogenase (short-subunit alcohol dehydrogenase family)